MRQKISQRQTVTVKTPCPHEPSSLWEILLYANRPDLRGGSTLGHISLAHVSVPTLDIGLAQLAMHSSYETAGARDTEYLVRAARAFYESGYRVSGERIALS